MTAREDAIEAVKDVARRKWAPRMTGLVTWEAAAVVDAVDPIIRADERERLRAQVEALWGRSSEWDDAIEAVLALLDEEERP